VRERYVDDSGAEHILDYLDTPDTVAKHLADDAAMLNLILAGA
jgi:hypothetical protein